MPVVVVPYQADWPIRFERVAAKLIRSLCGAALAVDHIGSSSVVGLAAKPIVDVQITVGNLAEIRPSAIESEGFVYVPELQTDVPPPWEVRESAQWCKLYFRFYEEGSRVAHIHVRERGRRNQRFALLFRDFLRASDRHRDAYGEFKLRLADVVGPLSETGGTGHYLDLKDSVVHLIADRAEQWAIETGWTP